MGNNNISFVQMTRVSESPRSSYFSSAITNGNPLSRDARRTPSAASDCNFKLGAALRKTASSRSELDLILAVPFDCHYQDLTFKSLSSRDFSATSNHCLVSWHPCTITIH